MFFARLSGLLHRPYSFMVSFAVRCCASQPFGVMLRCVGPLTVLVCDGDTRSSVYCHRFQGRQKRDSLKYVCVITSRLILYKPLIFQFSRAKYNVLLVNVKSDRTEPEVENYKIFSTRRSKPICVLRA